jgi:phosphoribosylformylglycinamidine synthase
MKFGVVVFPGSNCDYDTFHVLRDILDKETTFLWHKDHDLKNCDCIVLPGGFSYGDYLRSGAIARFSPLIQEITEFAQKGGIILGICNGFQVLLELGLIPGAMLRNKNLKFICKHIHIRIENDQTPFTRSSKAGQILKIPIAHFDGNYYATPETLVELKKNDQIVFRYSDPDGSISKMANVNGSMENIAGLMNLDRNVLGMMPHPERASEALIGSVDGKIIFESIIDYIESRK